MIPETLVSLASVEGGMGSIIDRAIPALTGDGELEEKVASVLRSQAPSKIDEALRAHIDKGLDFEENPLAGSSPQALQALMLLIQYGEAARRKLPAMPVSFCSLACREKLADLFGLVGYGARWGRPHDSRCSYPNGAGALLYGGLFASSSSPRRDYGFDRKSLE